MDAIKDLISCGICLEIYSDPHVLSCLHTWCASCIKEICKQGEVTCPECRGTSKIKSIKKNFHTQSLIDVYLENARPVSARARIKSEKGCEICGKGTISKKCTDCDKLICGDCVSNHGSIPSCSDHILVDLTAVGKQSREKLDDLRKRLEKLSKICTGKEKEVNKYSLRLKTVKNTADTKIHESEQEAIQKITEAHDEVRTTVKAALILEEKKLRKFGQHIKLASGEIVEMLELISEMTSARIDPARLVNATTELCDGVETNLTDLDVSSIQIGDLQVSVSAGKVCLEKPTCHVQHPRETCNTKEANMSLKTLTKSTLTKTFHITVDGGAVLRLYTFGKSIFAVQKMAILHFSVDAGLENKIEHGLLGNCRALAKLHTDCFAVACGPGETTNASILQFTMDGDCKGSLVNGDFCDLIAVGKKLYALSHVKQRISMFASNSHNKWAVTGNIALDTQNCGIGDTMAATSVSVLVACSKEGRIQEFTHSGEHMNDIMYPGDTADRMDVTEEVLLCLGSTDHAGAVLVTNTKTGAVKILDAHRKWSEWHLADEASASVSAVAVSDKGRVWIYSDDRLVCVDSIH